ncbi:VPS5 Vacuolar protein sorting-associated protein 5 [Candida maltosa Xu316]
MDNDDLTASVWDDAVSPNDNRDDYNTISNSTSNLHHSIISPLSNQFNSLAIDDPFASPLGFNDQPQNEPEEDDDDEEEEEEDQESTYNAVDEQVKEIEKEERKEHSNQLLSELTSGVDDSDILESSIAKSPEKLKSTDSIFHDNGESPIKIGDYKRSNTTEVKSPIRPINLKTTKFKASRPRKFSSKINVQHLQESSSNPLGPLSIGSVESAGTQDDKIKKKDDSQAHKQQQQVEEQESTSTGTTKKPENTEFDPNLNKLEIEVGDPMKVGDITTVHIVYSIKTKNKNLESKKFPSVESVEVSRRYKDFRWIYHQLQNNHPGKIIPPPPSKQTYIGRFNESFIENRRLSLEKMLNKISNSPCFCNDPDFVLFLTKERERLSGSGASSQNNEYLDGREDPNVTSAAVAATASTGGFMSSLFSMNQKVTEPDQYFIQKKQYIDDLEYNLKQFYKTIELIGQQRLDMIVILDEISIAMDELSSLEISKVTSDLLSAFSEVESKIKDNIDRINLQDQLTLGFTIEEYLRTIGSINFVFDTRLNIYQQYQNFSQELNKKQQQVDKINQLNFEVDKLKQRTQSYEQSFNKISDTIKQELENFEYERIDDFRNSVEIFIESAIESQKEAIELYETFYERQHLGDV